MSMRTAGRRRPGRQRRVYTVLGILACILAVWFAGYSAKLYNEKKLAEARGPMEFAGWEGDGGDGIIEYDGTTYERDPSIRAILLIGVDSSGDMEEKVTGDGGQADALIVAAHDVARNTVKILMIPRDTMTPITMTDLSGNVLGKAEQHINLAYGYGDGRELSCQYQSEAVSELLYGLSIDGYMAVNTSMIGTLNDLVGGVTVTVQVDGMEKRDPALKKGETVTLTGEQAELFVRYRDINKDNSAITRMSQQKQYMEAYYDTLRRQAAKDDQTVPRIMDAIEGNMVTDMGKDRYMKMALDLVGSDAGLSGEDILTLPGEAVVGEFFDEYHYDPEGTLRTVLSLFYREA